MKKEEDREKEETTGQKYNGLPYRAAIMSWLLFMAGGVSDLSRDKKLILHANGSVMLNLLQQCCKSLSALHANEFVMVALCNRADHYIFAL